MPQWLSGPQQTNVITPGSMYNYTWEGNNFTGGSGSHRHFNGCVLESLKDQFRKPAILHFLRGPKQFQILVPHKMIILKFIVHSGLQKLVADGFELAAECKQVGEFAGDMLDQFFVID